MLEFAEDRESSGEVKMEWILEIVDTSGRRIHLSRERWLHILKHPEMVNQVEQIRATLEHPDVIIQASSDPQVHFYFKYYKERREYLFISIKYLNGEGFIITSHYTDKLK